MPLPLTIDETTKAILAALTSDEIAKGVAYLDTLILPKETALEIDGRIHHLAWEGFVAFVDAAPLANWGHPCRYLIVRRETVEIISINAQFPPFLRGASPTLRVIWKAESVPEWAVAVHR